MARRCVGLHSSSLEEHAWHHGLTTTSLAEAREQAFVLRKEARSGSDPLATRREGRRVVATFEEASRKVHGDYKESWRNPKHQAQWINTLETYAFPRIGSRSVQEIETRDVLAVLSPIWRAKPETARRVRQRRTVRRFTVNTFRRSSAEQHHSASNR